MSFPSSVYPSDYATYKKNYMDMLNLQISINKKVFDAVTLKNRTGQLPIAPQDYRSMEEKYADVLGLQRQLSTNLGTITDAPNLALIMADLIKNPPLMNFIIMSFPAISEYMKKNYSIGVKYPIFMSYVEKLYRDAEKAVTDTLSDRVNQLEIYANQEDLDRLKNSIRQSSEINNLNKGNLVRIIDVLSNIMFTPVEIMEIKEGKKILSNTMLEAYKKIPLRKSPDKNIKTIQYFENEINDKYVPDEEEFTRDLYNILDDAVLAITLSKSGSRYETPELLQKEADAEIEAQRLQDEEDQRLQDEEDQRLQDEEDARLLDEQKKKDAKSKKLMDVSITAKSMTDEKTKFNNMKQTLLSPITEPTSDDVVKIESFMMTKLKTYDDLIAFLINNNLQEEFIGLVPSVAVRGFKTRFMDKTSTDYKLSMDTLAQLYKDDPKRYMLSRKSGVPQIEINNLIELNKLQKEYDVFLERTKIISTPVKKQQSSGQQQQSAGKGFGDITHSRFNILKGEVLAGNNSRVLINELIRHIHKMVQNKTVDYNQAMKSIDELNNL